jgi:hypothetical protein
MSKLIRASVLTVVCTGILSSALVQKPVKPINPNPGMGPVPACDPWESKCGGKGSGSR